MAPPDLLAAFQRRPKVYVLGLTVAALLAFGAVQAADLWMKRVQALQAADSRARNLAYILGEYVRGSFAVADTSLRQLAIHGRRVGGASAPDAEWRPILLSAREALPGSGSISIADADGLISHSTNPGLIGQARHNQFLYRHLSTLGRDEFVVDTPFLTPGPNPRYLLPIGRRLEGVSGGFDGVAVATVGPETYREFFRSVDVGADGVAWVFHPEGFIVFREPSVADPIGTAARDSLLFQAAVGQTGGGQIVRGPIEAGGRDFISAYQRLTAPPLIVAVSLSRATILAGWQAQLRNSLITFGVLAMTLGLIVMVLLGQVRERARVERELSEIQQLEADRLRETNERLASALQHEQQARIETEEAGRLKDEFLMTLSHELRTPLTAIYGWVRMLSTDALPPPERSRAIAAVERNARAQTRLIDDLLDVSRSISGKIRLDPRPIDVAEVVGAAVETLEPALRARRIRLERSFEPDPGEIVADPDRLQQVVWNLLSNATKFTPEEGTVRVAVRREGQQVVIVVSDTGVGIAADFLPYVFERFRQAEAGVRRRYGGLGLGLAVVRHLVELHGGRIEAASEGEGRGATFTVRLPAHTVKPAQGPARPAAAPPTLPSDSSLRLDGLPVLVVDDETDARELFESMLRHAGAVVESAASVPEAMALLAGRAFAVLLSDLEMPGEDGFQLLARARAIPRDGVPRLIAMAVTAYARPVDRQRALDAGFDGHLAKPVDPAVLVAAIASLVSGQP